MCATSSGRSCRRPSAFPWGSMRSMAIDRRRFLAGSAVALPAAHGRPAAAVTARFDETYFSGRADGAGHYRVAAFDGGGDLLLDCTLPARCHAIAVRPDGAQCIAVARRPGTFA